MKTLLIIDRSLGQARSHLATRILSAAAAKVGLSKAENVADAELVIVAGSSIPADPAFNGKKVYAGDLEKAVRDPEGFLTQAIAQTKPYQAVAPAATVTLATGPKRIVAITACPTGVAHTFMAAEAIESEAKNEAGG